MSGFAVASLTVPAMAEIRKVKMSADTNFFVASTINKTVMLPHRFFGDAIKLEWLYGLDISLS